MAADQERADRIRLLKQENPQLKWRHIADHVGVELRSAQMWQETGAISYDNAKRLAALVDDPERDVDWIMRGPRENTPSPFAGQDAVADELAAIRQEIQNLRRERSEEAAGIRALIRDVMDAVEHEKRVRAESEAATRDLLAAVDVASQALLGDAPRTEEAPGPRAT